MKLTSVLFSLKTTLILLAILAIGAGYATFIENDFGTSSARVLVYNNLWYEAVLVLTTINLIGVIFKYKMWKHKARFIFHSSFVVILIGAGILYHRPDPVGKKEDLTSEEFEIIEKTLSKTLVTQD